MQITAVACLTCCVNVHLEFTRNENVQFKMHQNPEKRAKGSCGLYA